MHLLTWKKILRQYEKFQKVASESRACELGENQKMMNREIVNLMTIKKFWSKHEKSITFWFRFRMHLLTWKKILRQYKKFQEVASELRTCELDENQKMMNRKIENLMKWSLKSMLRNHLINVTRTYINEMLNNDDWERYICI
jgi:division protein CdvB (Snf7/Vps24/ESCRT-III family)